MVHCASSALPPTHLGEPLRARSPSPAVYAAPCLLIPRPVRRATRCCRRKSASGGRNGGSNGGNSDDGREPCHSPLPHSCNVCECWWWRRVATVTAAEAGRAPKRIPQLSSPGLVPGHPWEAHITAISGTPRPRTLQGCRDVSGEQRTAIRSKSRCGHARPRFQSAHPGPASSSRALPVH